MKERVAKVVVMGAAVVMLLIVVATVAPGCNTVRGVGKDIASASEDVDDAVFGSGKSHTGRSMHR